MKMFRQFFIIGVILLVFKPQLIASDFCSEYNKLNDFANDLRFIATKDVTYIYLKHSTGDQMLYQLDITCDATQCPRIGSGQQLSQVFAGISSVRSAFIQDGFTYIFSQSDKVSMFDNKSKVKDIVITDFWKNVTHVRTYQWEGNRKKLLSRFIPTRSHASIGYSTSTVLAVDSFQDKTVELQGRYDSVYLTDLGRSYTFGENLVPTNFGAYLPLVNGDHLFTTTDGKHVNYMRKEGLQFIQWYYETTAHLLGCDGQPLPKRPVLSDRLTNNPYPTIDK